MKTIQWFPGHMAKAMRAMEESMGLVDAVVFVLDARCPASSYNPRLRALAGEKPVLYLLNKGDLADRASESFLSLFPKGRALRLSASSPASARPLQAAMEELVHEKAERLRAKGSQKPLRFMVAGIPNTGKSTVINLLSGAKKAVTGDRAGVTRAKQWVHCGSFDLLDTPGTMPPSCADQRLARRLAYVGCINDDILALDEIALSLLEELYETAPAALRDLGRHPPRNVGHGMQKPRISPPRRGV